MHSFWVFYGLNQSPIEAIVSLLNRFEMAQMGPASLDMTRTILVLVRGLFYIIKDQYSSCKEFRFRHVGAKLVI